LNLTRKKARVSLVASATAALVASGGLLATSAQAAPTPLTLNSGGTSPVVANLGTATTAAANASYALTVSGSDAAVTLGLLTAPASGHLAYQKVAGNGAATASGPTFTTLQLPATGTSEVQKITLPAADGGSFTITFDGQTTNAIAWNAASSAVDTAVEALSTVGAGNVAVTGNAGGPYTLTFGGTLANKNVAEVTTTGSLTSSGNPVNTPETIVTMTPGDASSAADTFNSVAATDYIYVTGDVPGAYTFRLYQDTNTNGQLDAADERATELITMTVVDAGGTGTTVATTDDVAPVITATSPINIGLPITAKFGYTKNLSTTDARGANVAGSLAARLAAMTFVDVATTGATGVSTATNQAASYTAATGDISYSVGTASTTGQVTIRADLKTASGVADNTTFGTKTVEVTSNGVTDVELDVAEVDGKVVLDTPNVTVKSGTAAVVYTATAIDDKGTGSAADDTPVANVPVWFALSGTDVASLTTDGTAVPGQSNTYAATTNASGVASLTVTSSVTTNNTTYNVDAASNNAPGTQLVATYEDAAEDSFEVVNTPAELVPSVGTTSVVLKGKLLDQFGQGFKPASQNSQQVTVQIDMNNSSWASNDTGGFATIGSDGTFSFTYTPSPAATAGQTDFVKYIYSGVSLATTKVQWASTATPASVTLTSPQNGATKVNLSDSQDIRPANGQSYQTTGESTANAVEATNYGDVNGQVTGTVYDANNAPIAFKKVTLTGSNGVWFSLKPFTNNQPANVGAVETSVDVVTNASGVFNGAYAFFTKPGAATVTATADTVSKDAAVTTDATEEPFKVIAIDTGGTPGSTLVVTGKVTDFFGNPVSGAGVDLSTGSSTIGTLQDTSVSTNSEGVWSTTFLSGSNQSGEVTLVATLLDPNNGNNPMTTNPIPVSEWSAEGAAGITSLPEHGEYRDQATITIAEEMVTLEATAVVNGGGRAFVSGTARPDSNVDVYIKPVGADSFSLYDVVRTDAEGEYGTSKNIARSTQWLARQGSLSSTVELSSVRSLVTIGGRALGDGRAVLAADGKPNARTNMRFYRVMPDGELVKIKTAKTNSAGYASFIWKTSPGAKRVRAYYTAPGTKGGYDEMVIVVAR
jgi:hypothetical protein